MPDQTPVLNLPYILPAQAQKHVTHNEAIRVLDVIVQLSVTARNLAAPPANPVQGDRYIVAAGAAGDWAGRAGHIALWENGAWQFFAPNVGWTAWVVSEQVLASFSGTAWTSQADGPLNVGQLGISATPDATNRLAVSSPATLLNHAGAGHQLKLNKALATDTASLLFQTGFSGRAEMGTAGGDDFSIKVSADGSAFVTGLSIAAATGAVSLPAALRLGGQASDPPALSDGMIWLNTTSGEVKLRSGGATVTLATGALGVSDGDKGDITVSATGGVWTIDAGAVSNGKLAAMPSGTFKARSSAGAGAPEDITAAAAAALLPVVTQSAKGLAPASGGGTANFLRADGVWAAPSGAAATLAGLGLTATAAQINPLAGNFAVGNSILMRENVNLAASAENFNSASWRRTSAFAEFTYNVTTGSDSQGPFVDYRLFGGGRPTTAVAFILEPGVLTVPITNGTPHTASVVVQRVAGSWAGVGLSFGLISYTAAGNYVTEANSHQVPFEGPRTITVTHPFAGPTEARAFPGIWTALAANTTVDITFRIRGLQLDRAAARQEYRYLPAAPAQMRAAAGFGELLVPAGMVGHFAMSAPPAGWLRANGALVSRTTFADLFAAIGTTFGAGNGSTTFALPDLRGEFLRGWDDGRGVDAGRALGSAQGGAFQDHTHSTLNGGQFLAGQQAVGVGFAGGSSYANVRADLTTGGATASSSFGAETRPRNVALLACIKF
jgi:microcystin-dependent protein